MDASPENCNYVNCNPVMYSRKTRPRFNMPLNQKTNQDIIRDKERKR